MPTDRRVLDLIKYIVCYATDHDIRLTTVRLVKFLYLADLYHARWFGGETFTKFPWAFVYYGPYCREVMVGIDEAKLEGLIASQTYESKYENKDYALFTCHDESYEDLRRTFPIAMLSELQLRIKKFGDDTAQLLDYVYFETEPMMDVKKGDRLDFSKAMVPRLEPVVETKKMSKENIEQIKAHIKNIGKKFKAAKDNLVRDERDTEKWKDDLYRQALDSFHEPEIPIGIEGTAKIRL